MTTGSSSINSTQDSVLMLFDLSIYGHHPGYIQYLIQYWYYHRIPDKLAIVVSSKFIEVHSDVVDLAQKLDPENIQFFPITLQEEVGLKDRTGGLARNIRNFQEWSLLCRYATLLKATQALLMYFDTYQLPLLLGMSPPCPVSGIYFRPTFHYDSFTNYQASSRDKWQKVWEKFVLYRVLDHPKFHRLFSLDPFVIKQISPASRQTKVTHLADPVYLHQYSPEVLGRIKSTLNIEPNRKSFLVFGALTGRKGIYELLEAVSLLPSKICEQISLIFIGAVDAANQERIDSKVEEILTTCPMQIVRRYEFVPEDEVQAYFHVSDVVLALYQRHVGMSGILLLAAAAQKPVLSANYGLMGELVQRYQLGLAVDSSSPTEIAKGLTQLLNTDLKTIVSHSQMKILTEQNSHEKFAENLIASLWHRSLSNQASYEV